MNRNFILLLVFAVVITSCAPDHTFAIRKDAIGPLTRDTKVSELNTVFANDSLVDESGNTEFSTTAGDIIVYEKGGKKRLQLSPATPEDNSPIKFIQIFDDRYVTEKGIGLKSTFKDIQDAYEIKRIDNLIGTIVIFVNDSDEYFTIDKKHLSANMMFDIETSIEATQIPDNAPLKYFMIGW